MLNEAIDGVVEWTNNRFAIDKQGIRAKPDSRQLTDGSPLRHSLFSVERDPYILSTISHISI